MRVGYRKTIVKIAEKVGPKDDNRQGRELNRKSGPPLLKLVLPPFDLAGLEKHVTFDVRIYGVVDPRLYVAVGLSVGVNSGMGPLVLKAVDGGCVCYVFRVRPAPVCFIITLATSIEVDETFGATGEGSLLGGFKVEATRPVSFLRHTLGVALASLDESLLLSCRESDCPNKH